jgi:hypothetical protein
LPIVIPVVLCHDAAGWRAPPEFAPMLDASPELLAAVGPFQPLFRFVLDDLEAQSLEDVVNAGEQLIAEGIEHGRAEGRAEGMRAAIERVLAARSLPLSEVGRARLASCVDAATLTRWLERAATATSEAEVFAGESA